MSNMMRNRSRSISRASTSIHTISIKPIEKVHRPVGCGLYSTSMYALRVQNSSRYSSSLKIRSVFKYPSMSPQLVAAYCCCFKYLTTYADYCQALQRVDSSKPVRAREECKHLLFTGIMVFVTASFTITSIHTLETPFIAVWYLNSTRFTVVLTFNC